MPKVTITNITMGNNIAAF